MCSLFCYVAQRLLANLLKTEVQVERALGVMKLLLQDALRAKESQQQATALAPTQSASLHTAFELLDVQKLGHVGIGASLRASVAVSQHKCTSLKESVHIQLRHCPVFLLRLRVLARVPDCRLLSFSFRDIVAGDVSAFLQGFGVFLSAVELDALLAKYDSNFDARISYREFLEVRICHDASSRCLSRRDEFCAVRRMT